MRPCVERLGPTLAALLLSVSAQASTGALDEQEAIRLSQAAIGRSMPDTVLLDRQGEPVPLTRYRGKPLLVSFIYTGCFKVCPAQTRALLDAVNGLDAVLNTKQYNVVSIGFNQPFDSPTAMRAFAAQHRVTRTNWDFLSPLPASVDALTRAFGFSYQATPAGFDHVVGVTLVDAEGRIDSQIYGDRLDAAQVGEPLRRLLRSAPPAGGWRVDSVIDRVRILCTVYDADTGAYRYDYKLLFEIAGGLTFFLSVGIYLWRDVRRRRTGGWHVAAR